MLVTSEGAKSFAMGFDDLFNSSLAALGAFGGLFKQFFTGCVLLNRNGCTAQKPGVGERCNERLRGLGWYDRLERIFGGLKIALLAK